MAGHTGVVSQPWPKRDGWVDLVQAALRSMLGTVAVQVRGVESCPEDY